MSKRPAALLIGSFLLLALVLFGYYNMTRPRILVVHSYQASFSWTQGLDHSFRQGLQTLQRPILTRWHYMNLDGTPSAQFIETATASARRAIQGFRPHILVVFDDLAAELITPELLNSPDIKVVFAGIDEPLSYHGFDQATNVAGMLERIPVQALHDTVTHLGQGRPLTLACVADNRPMTTHVVTQLLTIDWAPHTVLPCSRHDHYADWQAAIQQQAPHADLLFMPSYRGLRRHPDTPELIPPAEAVTWADTHGGLLTLATKVTFVPEGGALAITTSPHEHGHAAAQAAGALLRGTTAHHLPVATGKAFTVSASLQRLQRHGYALPAIYEAVARAANNLY